jgi:hypothetical protein
VSSKTGQVHGDGDCFPRPTVPRLTRALAAKEVSARPPFGDSDATAAVLPPRPAQCCFGPTIQEPSRSRPAASAALSLFSAASAGPFHPKQSRLGRRRDRNVRNAHVGTRPAWLELSRECDHATSRDGVIAKPREDQWRLVAASARSDRLTPGGRLAGSRERARTVRSRSRTTASSRPRISPPQQLGSWHSASGSAAPAKAGRHECNRPAGAGRRRRVGFRCRHCDRAAHGGPRTKPIAGRPVDRRLRGVSAFVRYRHRDRRRDGCCSDACNLQAPG